MSFPLHILSKTGPAPVSRRQALLGLTLLTLSACSKSLPQGAADESGIAYYTCTMHPFVRSQDPKGRCPVCGMDLVPVRKNPGAPAQTETDASSNAAPAVVASASTVDAQGIIQLSPERIQEIGVTMERVTRRRLPRILRAPARVEIDESTLRDINVKAGSGYITKLYANYQGMAFQQGDPLMTVLCEGWLQTQIDYITAYRSWMVSPRLEPNNSFALHNKLELMRARIRIWDLSNEQIDNLQRFAMSTNEIDLRTGHGLSGSFDLLAPFAGYVVTKKVMEGVRFEAGQSLLELADNRHLWVVAQFSEDQAATLNLGQKVTVTFPALPQEKIEGTLGFIDPQLDDQQRRIKARVAIEDEHHRLYPGMFAEVAGEVPAAESLTLSSGAVLPTGNKFIVFLDRGGGKLEPREIEIGVHSGDYYEVLSGLNEGDQVVVSANFLIDAESRIQGVLKTWGDRP